MLSIYATTDWIPQVQAIIESEERLSELVTVYDSMEVVPESSGMSLIVNLKGILQPVDWYNVSPPYLLQRALRFEKNVLLGLIFSKLGNTERAWHYLQDHALLRFDLGIISRLQHGFQIELNEFGRMLDLIDEADPFEQYRIQHNAAVVQHYGFLNNQISFQVIEQGYLETLNKAPNGEYKAFSAKHFATLLLDTGDLNKAVSVLEDGIEAAISDDAKFGLKAVLTNVWMKKLTVPYDTQLLAKLKDTLWETLQYFEKNKRKAEAGLLYVDAAHIANISGSFAESLGYITKATRIFDEEELEELAGNAHLRKGTLLYTWAQNGNPQFYKPAIESYQRALQVFRQEVAPDVFAEIHHNLAVLYAEMPAEDKKRGIWAGISVSSFQEALNFYTKEEYPYEYGMICNNYGNALMKFPLATHSDNYEKALFHYQEALSVRTPKYPHERAISLLNFLEASWNVSNAGDTFNEARYADMLTKAQEVKTLVQEPSMLEEADRHLELLAKLKEAVVL